MANLELVDLTLATAAHDLALDEVLLDLCEAGSTRQILRFWERSDPVVVVGRSGRLIDEVDRQACRQEGVEVTRRTSGGGTVLLGAGCLNYSLVLRIDVSPGLADPRRTHDHVMSGNARALGDLIGSPVTVRGCSDLTLDDLKFSGTAQHRKRRAVLVHGTILYRFDIGLVGRVLPPPPRAPEYRAGRSHETFLTNLPADPGAIRDALASFWGAAAGSFELPRDRVDRLVASRYGRPEWTERA